MKYDWSKITTVVAVKFVPEMLCIGHKYGAKVVIMNTFPVKQLENATARTIWVKQNLQRVQDNFLDGLNIDFEEPIRKRYIFEKWAYTALVEEAYKTFKAVNPNYQVTIDVPYSPNCIYDRCYDYRSLSSVTDFLVLMAYDEWDRQEADNFAGPIGDYVKTTKGIFDYIDLTIPAYQLLLAVPWYGDIYPCVTLSENMTWQLWYDDPHSLSIKYKFALDLGIRGVGMWNAECVDYKKDPKGLEEMWAALPRYNNTSR
ncbi:hypothetical protein FSP39_017396 [Pinctada imbricata]|uniref:GH18 domain-containing protein n=1 Tax=Pinctada imbricata TaxID=66713 RepID=A0AA88XMU0_PINIB|nr:hypothetical protein FSP39_017396 [Pinctada imbricata]